jgi:uncharacterized membrane protein
MTLAPFDAASLSIKLHIMAAIAVIMLTPVQFIGFRKGSAPHRVAGYLWLVAMVAVALSSFAISSRFSLSVAGFGLIHLLSVLTLCSCVVAVLAARTHHVSRHRWTLIILTVSFFVAGAFTFLPSRIMYRIVAG